MERLYGFSLFVFIPLIFSAVMMWLDIRGKSEFGKRPRHLMISIVIMFILGLSHLGLYYYHRLLDKQLYLLLFYTVNLLYYAGFFMLEYSIHSQRILKSFLRQDFVAALKKTIIFYVILSLYIVGTLALYLLSNVFQVIGEMKDPSGLAAVTINIIYLSSFITIIVFTNMNIFKLQKGIVRQKLYPFNTLLLINIVFFIINTIIPSFLVKNGLFLFFLFTIANIVYIIRMNKEYFYYSIEHLRLYLEENEKIFQQRNTLLQTVIKSPSEEDLKIIRSTMYQDIKKSQSLILSPEYGITGMMLYTAQGNVLKISSKEMILGHCIPIQEVKGIKHLNEEQITNKILQGAFDINRIKNTDSKDFRDQSEIALKSILNDKKEYVFERLPDYYKGLQRFIGIYPLFDNEKLIGALVVFKDNSEYLFPEEEKMIQNLSINIKVILLIMEGKFIQRERNRLQGEINIARNIQLSIIPKEIKLEGYDCASLIETTTEVGGDAYDFVTTENGNFFGIGDVSGHGLPAGIMALIQMAAFESSVFTAEILKKEIKPNEIYDTVNRVLCNLNKDRIGSDKFMTQNYLVENAGKIYHAGTHEIALHYLEKEEKVYELTDFVQKTAYLGLAHKINSEGSLGSFTLSEGDILVLYTDGLIEAQNHYHKQWGLSKLKEILQETAKLSSKEIIEKISRNLYDFAKDGDMKRHNGSYADDIAILVIKKL